MDDEAKQVLVIEDEMFVRELLRTGLESRGYQVGVSRDGDEGVVAANARRPDVIICDIMMPKEDGYSVCQKIRKSGFDVPFLFLTSKVQPGAVALGLRMGADDYVAKPFDIRELDARIQSLLRRRHC